MDDGITQRIKDGDFDGARRDILNIENSLWAENSPHGRKVLLERVRKLKGIYNSHNLVEASEVSLKEPVLFAERRVKVDGVRNKQDVQNVCDSVVKLDSCAEAAIENCSGCVFEHFECLGSVFLTNVKSCKISCSGQQIRMNGCTDVDLTVYTSTGVFIQDSRDITIRRHGDAEDNRFTDVHDFSSPFDERNFRIAEE